jgi:hypothetical protein
MTLHRIGEWLDWSIWWAAFLAVLPVALLGSILLYVTTLHRREE